MISLATLTGNNKYTGLLVKETTKGTLTYYMKYRDYNNKVVKKAIRNIPNISHAKALKEFNRVKDEIYKMKEGLSLKENKKINFSTLNEMADYYFTNHEFKGKDLERKRFDFHITDEEFASKPLMLVKTKDLNEFKNKMLAKNPVAHFNSTTKVCTYDKTKTLQPATVHNSLILCSTIIKYSIMNERYKGENPFNYVKRVKFDNVTLKQMTEEEIEKYLQSLKDATHYRYDYRYSYKLGYVFALLALTTGARKRTILQIKVENINLQKRTLSLYNFKTETPYIGHIVSDEIAEVLKEVCKDKESNDYIFYNLKFKKVYDGYPFIVKQKLDEVVNSRREEGEKLAVRDFRNVFATRLINKGMNLSHIQNLLNHKTPNMTMRYAQMLDTTGGDELKEMFSDMKL